MIFLPKNKNLSYVIRNHDKINPVIVIVIDYLVIYIHNTLYTFLMRFFSLSFSPSLSLCSFFFFLYPHFLFCLLQMYVLQLFPYKTKVCVCAFLFSKYRRCVFYLHFRFFLFLFFVHSLNSLKVLNNNFQIDIKMKKKILSCWSSIYFVKALVRSFSPFKYGYYSFFFD